MKIIKNKNKKKTYKWNEIEELNNPEPFWLRLMFYIMLIFSLTYWLLYPSWPTPNSHGILNWSSYKELSESQIKDKKSKKKYQEKFDKASFFEIFNNEKLLNFAISAGKSNFKIHCSSCHNLNNKENQKGFPSLTNGTWLWGGNINDIYYTIKYGIRSTNKLSRESEMIAFGKKKILTPNQINLLVKYILEINNKNNMQNYNNKKIKKIFQKNCVPCHGINAEGIKEFGAPNLRDKIWIYGSDYKTIYDVIYSGRKGVMPYWSKKLTDCTIKQLAIYIYKLNEIKK